MKPYSVDLRERIVQAVNDDEIPREDAAKQFRFSLAVLAPQQHLLAVKAAPHGLAALTGLRRSQACGADGHGRFSTGRPRLIRIEDEPRLLEQVQANNDLTLEEHCKLWKKTMKQTMKQTVSVTCMFESQKRAKITLKKVCSSSRTQRIKLEPWVFAARRI